MTIYVENFQYLGSIIADDGRIDTETDRRIANASKAFGALRQAVFKDDNLSVATKRKVYQSCVLSVLLYGAECWTPLRRHIRNLNWKYFTIDGSALYWVSPIDNSGKSVSHHGLSEKNGVMKKQYQQN